MMAERERADLRLVALGLCDSRARAKAEIEAGTVFVGGRRVSKPSERIVIGERLEIRERHVPYVSRAGLKLAHALDAFPVPVEGRIALDIGASTGGFTQVLLAAGAAHVYAIDVGHSQLHHTLRDNPKVTAIEGLNVKDLCEEHLPKQPQLIVCDVSFIGLRQALPAALALAAPGGHLVALIKPQFEAGRQLVDKGIVRDEEVRVRICRDIEDWLRVEAKWMPIGTIPSPVDGKDGNKEFLIAAKAER